jgi:steroid 5-alpha reductase family enzyme
MSIILSAWLTLIIFMCIVWLGYRITDNPGIVDVAWSVGHWLAGTLLLFAHGLNSRSVLLWLILSIWALRLAGYLFWTRIRLGIVDKRYTQLSAQWRLAPAVGFFLNFQLQGFLILLMVTSLYFNGQAMHPSLGWLDGLGLLTIGVGIVFATQADLELRRFVKAHKGQVCNVGLWRYSRHPNYFFEWLVWVGFSLTALSTPYGWLSIVSPIGLYLIMTRLTGPMTENGSVTARGDAYRAYQRTTSMFFPWISKGH